MSKKAVNAAMPQSKIQVPLSEIQLEKTPSSIYIITESKSQLDINKYYEFKQVLGSGNFGIVKLGISKLGNKQKVAIKSVLKERVKEDLQNLQRELMILKSVDHPNIIKLYEVFEDEKYIHIVMEYCSGGELFDRLEKKGKYSEKEAASLMYKLFHAINHMHISNISHRDLKPENCLFETRREDAELKLVDFGLASKFSKEKGMSTLVGTPYYVAPEIINGDYGPECDIWSLGVILYTLLVGYPPFRGENKAEIFKKVRQAKYSLKEKEFKTVSQEAKDLIKKLLNPDSKNRISAALAMDEPWFNIMMHSAVERPIDLEIAKRLHSFKAQSRMRIEIVKTMVQFLTETDLQKLNEAFRKFDKDHTGCISAFELEAGFQSIGLESGLNNIKGK